MAAHPSRRRRRHSVRSSASSRAQLWLGARARPAQPRLGRRTPAPTAPHRDPFRSEARSQSLQSMHPDRPAESRIAIDRVWARNGPRPRPQHMIRIDRSASSAGTLRDGSDGTRTRDLRRDRPVQAQPPWPDATVNYWLEQGFRTQFEPAGTGYSRLPPGRACVVRV